MTPANAPLGELPAVFASSGVGDLPDLAPSKSRCCGMFRGIVGERAEFVAGSVATKEDEDEVSLSFDVSSTIFGGESLRFLKEDVVKAVMALFPYGNKASRQKESSINVNERDSVSMERVVGTLFRYAESETLTSPKRRLLLPGCLAGAVAALDLACGSASICQAQHVLVTFI